MKPSKFQIYFANNCRCKIAGIRSLKGVETAVFGMKNIDLTKDAANIIGISVSCSKAILNELQ